MKTTSFTEHIHEIQGRVDTTEGVIRGVKILGPRSRNGREYTPQAIRQAAALYEGVRVNLDHPGHHDPPGSRSLADRLGVLRNVKVQTTGVYGDLFLLTGHPLASMVMEAAAKMPGTLGLSHNAEGEIRTEGGRTIVETIAGVHSVDLVQNPATVAGLFENTDDPQTTPPSGSQSDAAVIASLRRRIAGLEARVQEQQDDAAATQHCHSLLLHNQCPATQHRIEALKSCDSDEQRQQLIEAWQPPAAPRPTSSPGIARNLQSYADRTQHGIATALGR